MKVNSKKIENIRYIDILFFDDFENRMWYNPPQRVDNGNAFVADYRNQPTKIIKKHGWPRLTNTKILRLYQL